MRHCNRLVSAILILLVVSGCAMLPRDQFTEFEQEHALVRGFDDIRQWADASPSDLAKFVKIGKLNKAGRIDVLAISGGGAGGAFAAGLLRGWTESGQRPQFSIVTGVSTGALIAPFAFLGPDYDGRLEQLYRSGLAERLDQPQDPVSVLSGNGLLDPVPLRHLIETWLDSNVLTRIAEEDRKGRRLFVITTNLDAQRPVLWDIGKIAASGRPNALTLVREVLLASASIPAVYPPVFIRAQARGKQFEEMHVDGGATMQVFLPVEALGFNRAAFRQPKNLHLWVIVNNTLPPEFDVASRGTLSVAYRSLSTLMKSHARENVHVAFEAAKQMGFDFNLAFIDQKVAYRPDRPFGRDYMNAVFAIGRGGAVSGTVWRMNLEGIELVAYAEGSSATAK